MIDYYTVRTIGLFIYNIFIYEIYYLIGNCAIGFDTLYLTENRLNLKLISTVFT